MFVCAIAVPVLGIPQIEQANKQKITHPLVEFSKKYNLDSRTSVQPMFKFNESFTLESVEHQGWNGSEFISYYKTDFIHQGGNRTETRHYYKWEAGDNWDIDSREVYVFADNRLLSVTSQIVIEEEYVNDSRTLSTYQMIGDYAYLYETLDQFWNEDISDWENEERIEFTASDGELTGGESSAWDGTQWILYERFVLEEQDNDLHLTYQDFTGTEWINNERQIFENFSIVEMYLLFTEEMNILETGSFLTLAELLPDYTEQAWDGNEWADINRQVTEIEYIGETGQVAEKIIKGEQFDGEWITFSEVNIAYLDGKPHEMVLFSAEESENAELIPVFGEEFEYNEEKHLRFIFQKQPANESSKALDSNDLITVGRLVLEWGGASTSIGDETKPVTFSLGNAYPNPFNPSTVIPFQLGAAGDISIRVFDMLGRDVASLVNGTYPAGNHTVRFDAPGLSSGVYLIRLDAPGYQETRRVTLLK